MNTARPGSARQCGAALLAAVILVAIVGIGISGLYRHLHRGINDYKRFERDLRVLHLAEAGIDAAIARMRNNMSHDPASINLRLGTGEIQVSITPTEHPDIYRITSRATLRYGPVVHGEDTYVVKVLDNRDGAISRLSWHREKRQL